MSELLKVKGLKKHFPILKGILRHQVGVVKAVDGVDFTLNQGEVLGLVGESGSGKSTVARAAVRLIEPTAGQIEWEGEDLFQKSSQELKSLRREIQMVFQDPYASLNPRKTIHTSLSEGILYHQIVTEKTVDAYLEEVLGQVGLSKEMLNRYPHELSGGQQQRVCIGRAVGMRPKLLICDEAVSALDVSVQAQILNLLMELKEIYNLSYLFISHDLSVVRHVADRLAVMHHGKIIEEGNTEEIFCHSQEPYTKQLLAAIPKIAYHGTDG